MNVHTDTLRVRVASRSTETQDICSLELVPVEGTTLPAFTAGAHVDVHLPGGLVRQYSLCNRPGETHRYQIGVLRDAASRGGSQAVHEALLEGTELDISTPRNLFALSDSAPHHLLLAGGIGITPLLAMAEHLSAQGASFELHHCTRSRDRTPFVPRITAASYAQKAHHHFDDGDAAQKLDIATTLAQAPAGTHLYVCGPQGFMDAVLNAGRAAGWPEERLHREYFAAAPVDHTGDGSFEMEIASTGRVIPVRADQTALAALHEAGLDIPMSCEQGICGTCLTGVKAGKPDHRDQYLTPEEREACDQFLPCCSRASSPRLVLDL
ncbi:vanillate O-demethylase ferredoxin subunit [Hydrogenophaga palleronii]|uniref:Vanillate O-demethylase ferredoxin subunit n=1 Tax=Hydrogenophaga palleronii TaxID=65655 RepID=A0ABU1WLK5_9BURK|nr:PDR/VanB family oxidoreductase [Hydrogenophaga palleronii]MDR7149807.1 vanillate O-demethylase ferredoxin subunit [Hydrogenophaga palleronii]